MFGSNSLGMYDWMLSERVLSHGSYTNFPVGSLLTEGQGSLSSIAGLISGLFCQLCPRSRSLLQKLKVAQLVNELRAFSCIAKMHVVYNNLLLVSVLNQTIPVQVLISYLLKTSIRTIFQLLTRGPLYLNLEITIPYMLHALLI